MSPFELAISTTKSPRASVVPPTVPRVFLLITLTIAPTTGRVAALSTRPDRPPSRLHQLHRPRPTLETNHPRWFTNDPRRIFADRLAAAAKPLRPTSASLDPNEPSVDPEVGAVALCPCDEDGAFTDVGHRRCVRRCDRVGNDRSGADCQRVPSSSIRAIHSSFARPPRFRYHSRAAPPGTPTSAGVWSMLVPSPAWTG